MAAVETRATLGLFMAAEDLSDMPPRIEAAILQLALGFRKIGKSTSGRASREKPAIGQLAEPDEHADPL